jgi:hypothetical protein
MTAQDQSTDELAIRALYESILAGWNARSGAAFAAPFADDGVTIGYDGSVHSGRDGIAAELDGIFTDHPTARYVLRAIAGMVPPEATDIKPELNAHQTLVAGRLDGDWRVVLLQNTPAQFHGRPELAERMTEELREELRTAG